jgi:large subunit ribosomal protein L22
MSMEFRAEKKFLRISPQKARLVLDQIKGQNVEDALNLLSYSNKNVAPDVRKLLKSASDNAAYVSQEKGLELDVDNLFVKNAISNEGPRMKRIRPAPQGRAYRYQRRLAHISIVLAERQQTEAVKAAPAQAKAKKKAVAKKSK